MAPDPATSKSRGSRHRSNEAQHSNSRAGEAMERGSQRSETGKGKGEKDGGESGRGVKRRQHGGGGDGGQGGTSGSASRSKRWRGDALETLDIPNSTDRWDGGSSDTPQESAFSSGKNKQESESRSGEGIISKGSNVQLSQEGGDAEKAFRKQKVSKSSLVSDSRAITVMDLQETDISIIDTNIRVKNKVSYRREATLDVADPELDQSGEEHAKSAVEASRSRRRWDREGHKVGAAEDIEDTHARANVGREVSQERDRDREKLTGRDRHRDRDRDRDAEARIQNGQRAREGSRDPAAEVEDRFDVSDELDHSNDFKIQEELRNIELEKELENRIRRRREESGDGDKWRDDDREREGKRHSDSREERTRDERHRSRRDKDRHTDRYESRQHREGSRLLEGRQRDDRYYESDREYKFHREERYHGARSKDLDDYGRVDRIRDQEHRDRKGRENDSGYESERRAHDKGQKEEAQERERSYPAMPYVESSDGGRSEHRHKRARENDGDGYGTERDQSRQRSRPGESDTVTGSDLVHDDRSRRNREDRDAEGRLERSRGSPRDNDGMRGKGRGNNWRNDGPASEMGGESLPSPRHDARESPSPTHLDYTSSPHLDEQRSPRYLSQRSPSSHIDMGSAPSRGKASHGDWFERSNSVSTSSGPQRRGQGLSVLVSDRRDRIKWHTGSEEEVRSGIFRANRNTEEGREGSGSPHRHYDQHLSGQVKPPVHGQDNFPRGMGSRGAIEARSGGWRAPLQAGSTAFDGGPLDHHGPDDLSPQDRNDRLRRIPMNRPPGSPMVRSQGHQGPQLSLPVPPLAPLPPPPPFRPGIDNPAVLGPLNGGFDETNGSREQGRGDRKGAPLRRGDPGVGIGPGEGWRSVNIGNWNSRNQGLLPGTGFPPFPPQFGHPQAGGGLFPAMGQQFPGPPIFPGGGGRPPLDMAFVGGGRFLGPGSHMGEGGDGYLGPGRGTGWHGPGEVDDGRGPPLLGPGDGWDGPGPHGDDRLRHGRMDWARGGPMGVRGWERDRERDIWEGRGRDGAPDFMPHRSQMEPPPQNHAFPPAGTSWGMARDTQVSKEVKPQWQSFDSQEVKRKPDGGPPKPKVIKPSAQGVSVSEGKHAKYATATIQSILSQLDISPELAGPELYAQYRALLPVSESGKSGTAFEEEENAISEPADDDLNLEVDPEAEVLIARPNLLAKLLPPLPDTVFEEALRLYRKPETDNRVQRSLRGCFVLPFDPSTIKVPSISLKFKRSHPVTTHDQPLTGMGGLLDQLDDDVLNAEFREGFIKPNNEPADIEEERQEGLELLREVKGETSELEDREGEATQDEFMSRHVEVAEYSDREFEAEMDDVLEDDSVKEVHGGEVLSERMEPSGEEINAVDILAVYRESIHPVDTLDQTEESLTEVNNSLQVAYVPDSEEEDVPEDDSVKDVQGSETLSERLESSREHKDTVDILAVNNECVDPVDTLDLDKGSLKEVHNNLQVVYVSDSEEAEAETEAEGETNDQVDKMDAEAVPGENVNNVVVSKGAVNSENVAERTEEISVLKEEGMVLAKETVEPLMIHTSEALTGQFNVPQNVQFSTQTREEFSPEASVSKEVIEAAGEVLGENLETKLVTMVEEKLNEALVSLESFEGGKDPEDGDLAVPTEGEGNGPDPKHYLSETVAAEEMQNLLPKEGPDALLLQNDVRMETNGKLKEIVENPEPPDQPAIEEPQLEPVTRLRKRRASSRLLAAQQSVEAQVTLQQEASDGLVGPGSAGIKKVGTRGKTRSSARRSKRRGSTH